MAAKSSFDEVIQRIKESNLNFTMTLTPFSAYITIKSSFIRGYKPTQLSQLSKNSDENSDYHELSEENKLLLDQVEILENRKNNLEDTIKTLEEKISKCEASAYKSFEERNQEIATLKHALKNKDHELVTLKKEFKLSEKVCKEKEKEEYRLARKVENLNDNLNRCKSEFNTLKSENKNLLKKNKSQSVKLLNSPPTPMPVTVFSSSSKLSSTESKSSPPYAPSATLMASNSSTTSHSTFSTPSLPLSMSISTPTSTLSTSMASSAAPTAYTMAETNNNSFVLVHEKDKPNPTVETFQPENRFSPCSPTRCTPLPRTTSSPASKETSSKEEIVNALNQSRDQSQVEWNEFFKNSRLMKRMDEQIDPIKEDKK